MTRAERRLLLSIARLQIKTTQMMAHTPGVTGQFLQDELKDCQKAVKRVEEENT